MNTTYTHAYTQEHKHEHSINSLFGFLAVHAFVQFCDNYICINYEEKIGNVLTTWKVLSFFFIRRTLALIYKWFRSFDVAVAVILSIDIYDSFNLCECDGGCK